MDESIPSLRTQLALQKLETDATLEVLGEKEKLAFLMGFRAGTEKATILGGAVIAVVFFGIVLALPFVYLPLRALVRPWALRQVEKGHATLITIQKIQHPILDMFHKMVAFTCTVEFYITFIPLLFWSGESLLARHLCMLMNVSVYVGNACKDIVCSERPDWRNGVLLKGFDLKKARGSYQEYGLPSTHTINTISLVWYMLHFYNFYGPGKAKWLHENMIQTNFQVLVLSFVVWSLTVMYGRMYLGMHSPVDIAAGVVIGALILLFYIPIEEFADAWLTHGRFVPAYQLAFAVIQMFAYPVPLRYTPSYNYVIYFIGVTLGIVIGIWSHPELHSAEACLDQHAQRGPLFTWFGLFWTVRRFLLGMVITLSMRAVGKIVFLKIVLLLYPLFGIPISDHDKYFAQLLAEKNKKKASSNSEGKEKKATGFNQNSPVRLFTYAFLSWGVTVPCLLVFQFLGI